MAILLLDVSFSKILIPIPIINTYNNAAVMFFIIFVQQ